jgi:hypothetical protein
MELIISNCAQNSDEWHRLRSGIPTASSFSAILAKGEGKTRKAYLNRLAAEIYTGEPLETFKSADMERGHAMEDEARDLYIFQTGTELQRVGFVRKGRKGCSPDALIGDDGILEIKTQRADLLVETLTKGEFPKEHIAQCQGALWVTGRKYIDIAVYWPKMPLFVKRAHRDEGYIANLAGAVNAFNEELDQVVKTIRAHGGESTLAADLQKAAEAA